MNRVGAIRFAIRPASTGITQQTFFSSHCRAFSSQSSSSSRSLDFDDVSRSFASKTDDELLRALLVYRICTIRPIVNKADTLLSLSNRVLGRSLTRALIKPTFFSQFCAGEDANEIKPVVDRLEKAGLGAILDYAAEADVGASQGGTGHSTSAVHDPSVTWRENTKLFADSIVDAGVRADGFAAIKVTAITDPEILIKLTDYCKQLKNLFQQFSLIDTNIDNKELFPNISLQQTIKLETLKNKLNLSENEIKIFSLNNKNSSSINFIEWMNYFSPFSSENKTRLESLPQTIKSQLQLDDKNRSLFLELKTRCDSLAKLAEENKVRLLVDAEQTYFQNAIDLLVLSMQATGNKKFPYILNTYQCYLRDTYSRILIDSERANNEGWKLGAKTVRGAYMRQERQRAKDLNYNDPICANFNETTNNYQKVVEYLLTSIANHKNNNNQNNNNNINETSHVGLVIAGHNESTVRWATNKMSELNLSKVDSNIWFGQLLGMCDHVSYALAENSYKVVKVCPYGPIEEVMPYLIRRAQENADVLDRATKEMKLLKNELIRRKLPAFLSSSPASTTTSTPSSTNSTTITAK